MLSSLGCPVEGEKVYSFGKITAKLEDHKYELAFRERRIILTTEKLLDVNTWIRVYGTFCSGILRAVFIDRLNGVDMNLFEKAVNYVKERL